MKNITLPEIIRSPKTDFELVLNIHCHNAAAFLRMAHKNWHDEKVSARWESKANEELTTIARLNPGLKLVGGNGEQVLNGLLPV